jgi:hypothetical protein
MKTLSVLLVAALGILAAATGWSADKAPAAGSKPTAGAKPATAPAAPKPVEKEEPIVGALLDRPGGGFLNLKVEGGNFQVRFLDAKKKPVDGELQRGLIRFRKGLTNFKYALSAAADGKTMHCPQAVKNPYLFKLSLVLYRADSDEPAETYSLLFRQLTPGDDQTISGDELTPEEADRVAK